MPATGPLSALSEQDELILALEHRLFIRAGSKEQAIRDELGCSAVRYYWRLNQLLDSPAALARDPVLIGRLRRLREVHVRRRGG